jgi:hypothetical protein
LDDGAIIYYDDTALDSRHSTRTHTTTSQKQSAKMEGRRERRCGHGEVKIYRFGDGKR